MTNNCLWRHKNNTTMAFEVITRFWIKEKREWSLKVVWWNVGNCHEPWPLGITQRINIPGPAISDWVRMNFGERCPAPKHVHL